LFPFRFLAGGESPRVTASFCCPTVVANEGALLSSQTQQLRSLAQDWFRAYPAPVRNEDRIFADARRLKPSQVEALRAVLRSLLERQDAQGQTDLRTNVTRMAAWLEDLTRLRVMRLDDGAFAEYLAIMGRHAVGQAAPPDPRPPSRLGRLLFRGFLFTVLVASERLRDPSAGRFGLRLRTFRLLLHAHGLGPGVGEIRLSLVPRSRVDLGDADTFALVHRYLRISIDVLGLGQRPVLDELAVAFAFLNAALVISRMRAAASGQSVVDLATLSRGLMEASDLTHADPQSPLGRRITFLAGGVESLGLFASERLV
jgi:hypothetical protein